MRESKSFVDEIEPLLLLLRERMVLEDGRFDAVLDVKS